MIDGINRRPVNDEDGGESLSVMNTVLLLLVVTPEKNDEVATEKNPVVGDI